MRILWLRPCKISPIQRGQVYKVSCPCKTAWRHVFPPDMRHVGVVNDHKLTKSRKFAVFGLHFHKCELMAAKCGPRKLRVNEHKQTDIRDWHAFSADVIYIVKVTKMLFFFARTHGQRTIFHASYTKVVHRVHLILRFILFYLFI